MGEDREENWRYTRKEDKSRMARNSKYSSQGEKRTTPIPYRVRDKRRFDLSKNTTLRRNISEKVKEGGWKSEGRTVEKMGEKRIWPRHHW